MKISAIGAVLAMFNVALSAAGTHAFGLNPIEKSWFDLASHYIYIHALAIIAAGFFAQHFSSRLIQMGALFLLAGIFLFSGSLYVLAIFKFRLFPMSTPLGGMAFMIGWALLAIGFWRAGNNKTIG